MVGRCVPAPHERLKCLANNTDAVRGRTGATIFLPIELCNELCYMTLVARPLVDCLPEGDLSMESQIHLDGSRFEFEGDAMLF